MPVLSWRLLNQLFDDPAQALVRLLRDGLELGIVYHTQYLDWIHNARSACAIAIVIHNYVAGQQKPQFWLSLETAVGELGVARA